jgi:pyridoxamine 5'-phosphate oxidase family protein
MMRGRTRDLGFTDSEVRYILERKLGRIALVSSEHEPHIVPVTYEFDGTCFYLHGWNIKYGPRFTDMQPEGRVSLLIDDLTTAAVWVPRGIEVTGTSETLEKGDLRYMRITPVSKTSWGL